MAPKISPALLPILSAKAKVQDYPNEEKAILKFRVDSLVAENARLLKTSDTEKHIFAEVHQLFLFLVLMLLYKLLYSIGNAAGVI